MGEAAGRGGPVVQAGGSGTHPPRGTKFGVWHGVTGRFVLEIRSLIIATRIAIAVLVAKKYFPSDRKSFFQDGSERRIGIIERDGIYRWEIWKLTVFMVRQASVKLNLEFLHFSLFMASFHSITSAQSSKLFHHVRHHCLYRHP